MKKQKQVGSRLKRSRPIEGVVAAVPLFGWILFGIFPLAMSVYLSFTELHSSRIGDAVFIGLENFKTLFSNAGLASPLLTTGILVILSPLNTVLALFIALKLSQVGKLKKFFSTVSFIPCVCSVVATGIAFKIIFREEGGVLNSILNAFGFKSFGWLSDSPIAFMISAQLMRTWSGLGTTILMYQAAIAGVDKSYCEAAELDGATPKQIFWKITFPALTPITGYFITMGLIGALQSMADMMILTPETGWNMRWWPESTFWVSDTISKYIYNMIFVNPRVFGYGIASAAGWVLALIILIITRINMKAQEKWVCYDF